MATSSRLQRGTTIMLTQPVRQQAQAQHLRRTIHAMKWSAIDGTSDTIVLDHVSGQSHEDDIGAGPTPHLGRDLLPEATLTGSRMVLGTSWTRRLILEEKE